MTNSPTLHTRPRRWRVLLALLILLLLPGLPAASAQDGDPAGVVAAFLDAWNQKDAGRMYSYLSAQSKEAYPEEVFRLRYQRAQDVMEFSGLTYNVTTSKTQGITAAVRYDVQIQAGSFGVIDDPGRTMRLVWDGARWGIAWSSLDIFDLLTERAELTSSGRLPERANIYDRNGNLIAGRGQVAALLGRLQDMSDRDRCEIELARLTRRPRLAFTQWFARYNSDTYFYIVELNADTYRANQANLDPLCGVTRAVNRDARTYYGNNAMAHVTGWVGPLTPEQLPEYARRGYSQGDTIGQSGIEQAYQNQLAGNPERLLRITDPRGITLREFASTSGSDPTPLQLTIDRDLQLATAQAMADAYDYARPNWGGVAAAGAAVVLDVSTGAILAMVSYPLVDPLLFDSGSLMPRVELLGQATNDPRRPFRNHAIQDQYEPGSVYKIFTLAAALNEQIIASTDTFDCQLWWEGRQYGDTLPRRADWRVADEMAAAGVITPAQALMSSCNPFFYQQGALLYRSTGRDMVADYARRFGLGRAYDVIGNGTAVAGNVANPNNATAVISGAVGQQDVQIPPIQMAVAVAAVANGGTVYRPYLVQQVGGLDGTAVTRQGTPEVINTLDFAPGVLETIQQGMCGVVENDVYGTAWLRFRQRPYSAPYTACGKTGTAQTAGYPNAWFVAYAPADAPRIAVVVMVAQSLEGSQIAAPITRRILDYYFGVPGNQIAPFPDWWAIGPYRPLNIPQGATGG